MGRKGGSDRSQPKYLYEQIDDEIKQIKSQQRQRRRVGVKAGPLHSQTGKLPMVKGATGPGMRRSASAPSGGRRKDNQMEEMDTFGAKKEEMRRVEEEAFMAHKARMRAKLNELHKKFNVQKHIHDEKQQDLNGLKAELQLIENESAGTRAKKDIEEQILRQQGHLEKTEEKVQDLQRYQKVMEKMAQRLWRERHTYEKTLRSYEEALKVRKEEVEEMRELVAKVRHLKTEEENKLEQVSHSCKTKLDVWERELEERRALAKQQEEMRAWFQQKQQNELNLALTSQKEEQHKGQVTAALENANLKSKLRNMAHHVNAHEEAFRKIQMATGLVDEEEIVERYVNREQYIQEIDDRIDKLRQEILEATARHDKMKEKLSLTKYSGGNGNEFNRELIDDLTRRYDEARRTSYHAREEYNKLNKVVVEIEQTVDTLFKMLRPLTIDDPKKQAELPVSDGTVESEYVRKMYIIAEKITKAIEMLSNPMVPPPKKGKKPQESSLGQQQTEEMDEATINKLTSIIESSVVDNRNNVRVRTKVVEQEEVGAMDAADSKAEEEEEDVSDLFQAEEAEEWKQIEQRLLRGKLRARALRLGKSIDEVEASFKKIPHDHVNKTLTRGDLKKSSLQLYQKSIHKANKHRKMRRRVGDAASSSAERRKSTR